jgi:hypothetical protein
LTNAENVVQNSEFTEKQSKSTPKLYLKVSSMNAPVVKDITKLLKDFSGDAEIIFYDSQTKKYIKATELSISVNEQVLSILKAILGEESVIYKE